MEVFSEERPLFLQGLYRNRRIPIRNGPPESPQTALSSSRKASPSVGPPDSRKPTDTPPSAAATPSVIVGPTAVGRASVNPRARRTAADTATAMAHPPIRPVFICRSPSSVGLVEPRTPTRPAQRAPWTVESDGRFGNLEDQVLTARGQGPDPLPSVSVDHESALRNGRPATGSVNSCGTDHARQNRNTGPT